MLVDSCKSCKKPQWSNSEGRFLLASLLGLLYLTGVSMRLSHPTDNAKIAVHLMLFRLLRETFVWVWLAPLSVCLHRKTSIKVGGDKIPPSFDLVLVVLKSACFSLFLNFGIIDISSTPGQTDLLNSSEALWEGIRISELALLTAEFYSFCLWKAILNVQGSLRPSLYEKGYNTLQKM